MNRSLAVLVSSALAAMLLVVGCSSATPAPTTAPAAPTKTGESTKAAVQPASAQPTVAPQPTAAPTKKVEWPEKGKAIIVIVPFAAGGTTDLAARILASYMEKDLGVPVQVVNKAGASSQTGLTDFVKSKPDGYTLTYCMLQYVIPVYLDPERKAIFGRKDFVPIAMVGEDPKMVVVKADSPYKTMKDLVEAAKAKPGSVKFGAGGVLSPEHIWALQMERATSAKFATVQFDGVSLFVTALLGGHIDFIIGSMGSVASPLKDKQVRLLAIADRQATPLAPEVSTIESQGYKVNALLSRIVAVPAGTPKEVVDILTKSVEKVTSDPAYKSKIEEIQMDPRYTSPEKTAAYWEEVEKDMTPIISLGKQ